MGLDDCVLNTAGLELVRKLSGRCTLRRTGTNVPEVLTKAKEAEICRQKSVANMSAPTPIMRPFPRMDFMFCSRFPIFNSF
jgi:hypothetical protein